LETINLASSVGVFGSLLAPKLPVRAFFIGGFPLALADVGLGCEVGPALKSYVKTRVRRPSQAPIGSASGVKLGGGCGVENRSYIVIPTGSSST
jgi:hypothetical protein